MKFDYRNIDCMIGMAEYPDKYFDLAIVDPPYGIGNRLVDGGGTNAMIRFQQDYYSKSWDNTPDSIYFNELFKISRNQIICGGNYFGLPPNRCFIVWDKKVFVPTMSRCEYLWTSFDSPAKIIEISSTDTNRFHPTQKPIALYKWLLTNYAKQGDKILDTHVGSASSIIACLDLGFEVTGFELDPDYYRDSMKRIEKYLSEPKLFTPEEIPTKQENNLFE